MGSLVVEVTRNVPGDDDGLNVHSNLLPLAASVPADVTAEALAREPGLLGFLPGSDGGTVALTWPGIVETTSDEAAAAIVLEIESVPGPGTYVGTIDLLPEDDGGLVQFTAKVTDLIVWPLIALVMGILGALLSRRYLQVYRAVWGLERDLASTRAEFALVEKNFIESSSDQTYAGYTISSSFNALADKTERQIKKLKKESWISLDKAAQAQVAKGLDQLKSAVEDWRSFAGELADLSATLDGLTRLLAADVPAEAASANKPLPALVSKGAGLLKGKELMLNSTADGFAAHRDQVVETTSLGQTCGALADQLGEYQGIVRRLENIELDPADQTNLETAREILAGARWDLWQIDEPAGLVDLDPTGDLKTAADHLSQLAGKYLSPSTELAPPAATIELASARIAAMKRTPLAPQITNPPVRDYENEAHTLRARLRRWDTASFLVSLAVAVFSGLNVFYFGKTFGTVPDYVTALLWGATTQVVVDGLIASIGRLRENVKFGAMQMP